MMIANYFKITPIKGGSRYKVSWDVRIKWWGIPIVFAKAMNENFVFDSFKIWSIAWFYIYPKCVLRAWFS